MTCQFPNVCCIWSYSCSISLCMYMFNCSRTSVLGSMHFTMFNTSEVEVCCICKHIWIFWVEATEVFMSRFTLWQSLMHLIIHGLFVWMSSSALILFCFFKNFIRDSGWFHFFLLKKDVYNAWYTLDLNWSLWWYGVLGILISRFFFCCTYSMFICAKSDSLIQQVNITLYSPVQLN